jgi:nucleotide-binding universal stress UspA family protein
MLGILELVESLALACGISGFEHQASFRLPPSGSHQCQQRIDKRRLIMDNRILVAFDDSENALRAVEYVADRFTKENQITLFSIVPDTAALCDMNSPSLIPYFMEKQAVFCGLEDQKKELVDEAMLRAKDILLKAGFDEKNIALKVQTKKKGVVRDIIDEAHSGYDTIVLGRRGLSGVKDFIFGSVSQKLLHLARDVSIIVVD